MTKHVSLKIVLCISVIGILFSGYLSYREIFLGSCNFGILSCGKNTPPIFGVPACVYGLFMYICVFVVSIFGLKSKK